ncbi:MAG: 16S rRNA (cytosine(1402)-N(4))-methyltransferase RsmH, partial [Clostridia bacterium]|nr:16S rRNA (cytosine(1402)-N(4))-methyltransferase RsmH [Clostridia bacterium]
LCYNLDELGIDKVDGILLDLGVSSPQIDDPNRGFSYSKPAPLDMRMDTEQELDAKAVINGYSEEELARIFFEYGEDKLSRKIARAIVREREKEEITTTDRLADIIERCYPAGYRFKHGHPAKRVFQAVRIEVNGELEGLYDFIYNVALRLKVGGRMAVITFHSLEDRIVKNAFVELEKDCICDKRLPVCVCNKRQEVKILTKKPIVASESELKENKRAESAKLRIIERV